MLKKSRKQNIVKNFLVIHTHRKIAFCRKKYVFVPKKVVFLSQKCIFFYRIQYSMSAGRMNKLQCMNTKLIKILFSLIGLRKVIVGLLKSVKNYRTRHNYTFYRTSHDEKLKIALCLNYKTRLTRAFTHH